MLGAAAAVLALALLVPLVVTLLGRSGDTVDETASRSTPSTMADAGMAATEGAGDDTGTGAVPGAAPSTTTGPTGPATAPVDAVYLGDLGAVPDTAALRARVGAALATATADGQPDTVAPPTTLAGPEPPTPSSEPPAASSEPPAASATPAPTGASAACEGPVTADTGDASLRARAEGALAGEPVVVYVVEEEGGLTVLVVDPTTCTVRARLPL